MKVPNTGGDAFSSISSGEHEAKTGDRQSNKVKLSTGGNMQIPRNSNVATPLMTPLATPRSSGEAVIRSSKSKLSVPKGESYKATDSTGASVTQQQSAAGMTDTGYFSKALSASSNFVPFAGEEKAGGDVSPRFSVSELVTNKRRSALEASTTCRARIHRVSVAICDSWRFCFLTTILTFYALFGDDFRLAVTHKDVDSIFNVTTIVCIIVFSFEIIVACIGREGYFMGFFFALDVISTFTLVLDLTWVGDLLLCSTSEAKDEAVRTSRAGRVGARASRTVRILRLLRLVKLYKAYRAAIEQKALEKRNQEAEAQQKNNKTPPQSPSKGMRGSLDPGDDHSEIDMNSDMGSEADMDVSKLITEGMDKNGEADDDDTKDPETRVGKKLSEMTTRRVIVLVLVMLFVLPQFTLDSTQVSPTGQSMTVFQTSAHWGISLIYERWREWCPANSTDPSALPSCLQPANEQMSTASSQTFRGWYERYLSVFIYNHCEGPHPAKLGWLGVNSESLLESQSKQSVADYLGELAQLGQEKYLGKDASSSKEMLSSLSLDGSGGRLPASVEKKLTSPWLEQCRGYYGVATSTSLYAQRPTACSIERHLRCSEIEYFFPETRTENEDRHFSMMFAFDRRQVTKFEAFLSILQTIFICLAVGFGSMLFSRNVNTLLLIPIQSMISKMETIKVEPLEAMKLGDLEYMREEIEAARKSEELATKNRVSRCVATCQKKQSQPMETIILEKTIVKLGGFLCFCFGDVGAEVVGKSIHAENASVELDAMVPGAIFDAVVCNCGIHDFSVVLEALQEGITVYVNRICEIVHGCVVDYHGAPNKGYGDSFLLVWRLCTVPAERRTQLADMAVVAVARMIAFMAMSKPLSEYTRHPILRQRIPGFRPMVGFGLHYGTVVECTVGSDCKIDPLYLSKNMKVASQLQAATQQYGVQMLLSHLMIPLLSHEIAVMCRLIDHVVTQGSWQPVRIFTIDLDTSTLIQKERFPHRRLVKNRFKRRQLREVSKHRKLNEDYKVYEEFVHDEDLAKTRALFTHDFFMRFATAYRNYEAGCWSAARDMFVTCEYCPSRTADSLVGIEDDEWPPDGPTVALLTFMRRSNYRPPEGWAGYRKLQFAQTLGIDHPYD